MSTRRCQLARYAHGHRAAGAKAQMHGMRAFGVLVCLLVCLLVCVWACTPDYAQRPPWCGGRPVAGGTCLLQFRRPDETTVVG